MKAGKNLILAMLSLGCLVINAQKKELRKGFRQYEDLSYIETSKILQKVADRGFKSVDLFEKLGDSYYFNNKMEEAAKWYGELMALEQEKNPEYYFRYAQSLKSLGRYTDANTWMLKFHEAEPHDLRAHAFISASDYLSTIEKASRELQLQNLSINTQVSDFGAYIHEGSLIFSSSRGKGRIYKWNNQPFLELFKAENLGEDYGNVESYGTDINTQYHESSVAFTPNGKWMFFTRSNYYKKTLLADKKNISRLKLFRLNLDEGNDKIKSVHFNSNDYSVANPTINKEGDRIFFSSDMPGTFGQSDVYMTVLKPDARLGNPMNLGIEINTEGRETFPFINEKGDLFFASDGYNGLGGLDIYVVRDFENKRMNDLPLLPENLGKPFNSPQDDFAYYENMTTGEGFFSSDRPGGKGDDDIYRFTYADANHPSCSTFLSGVARDNKSGDLLKGAVVTLYNADGEQLDRQTTDNEANYRFDDLQCDTEYLLRVEKDFYRSDEQRFLAENTKTEKDMTLAKNKIEISKGDNLRELLDLNPIYFDLGKWFLRPDAEIELQKIIAVLEQYPTIQLKIKSHTDSQSSMAYNQVLSEQRFLATITYLVVVGGIDPERLSGGGYGETELMNDCSDGRSCSKEEHQLNRRSDFLVVFL